MRIVKRNVYYCDFCGKHGLSRISIHEKHCTKNPGRECRLCGRKDIKILFPNYTFEIPKEFYSDEHSMPGENVIKLEEMLKKNMDRLREEVDECPNCILTVIRLNNLSRWPLNPEFNYKEEIKKWWERKNEEERRKEEESLMYDV